MNEVLLILSSCAFMGAAIAVTFFFTSRMEAPQVKDGSLIKRREELSASSPLWRFLVRASALISPIHSRRELERYLGALQARLSSAGYPGALRAEEFLTAKEFFSLICILTGLLLGFGSFLTIFLLAAFGFFLPDLWLRDTRRRRYQDILRALPLGLDLLTLCVEAGLDLISAIGRIVEKLPSGPFREELFLTLQEIRMGKGRSEAIKDLAGRVNIPEVSLLTSAIVQAGEMGIGVGNALKVYSTELRAKRFREAEKRAMEAPVKMSIPLLFIFTSVFILLFGALALDVIRGGIF